MSEDLNHRYIEYLAELREREDRGALAALRRGLGLPPGNAPEMYPYVVPWLSDNMPRRREETYFLIASLFAYHPAPGGNGNMGAHYAQARDPQGDNTAIERRFTALLAAHGEDLPFYLRQAVSFLRAKEIPVDWKRLLDDLQNWERPGGRVQLDWARAFWGRGAANQISVSQLSLP